jgi:hypothetical protein
VMPLKPTITGFESLDRQVLFAVELIDPVTQSIVYRGVDVRAAGFEVKPIVSHSGRFVWLQAGAAWPGPITVDTGRLPFMRHLAAPPPRPPDITTAPAEERRVRISLRPTTAYPMEDGVTAIRGALWESTPQGPRPIVSARVQLAWRDDFGNWSPLPPPPETVGPGEPLSPREQETTTGGDFVVFLNLPPNPALAPDLDDEGFLAVRLQVTQGRSTPMTRVTSADFPFLPAIDDPTGTRLGRVREGRVLAREVRLTWNDLTPI